MILPPMGTVGAGVNTSTGWTIAPATCDPRVMESNTSPVMEAAFTPGVRSTSTLDDILKPPVTAARTLPSFSPVRVMVIMVFGASPEVAPAVVRTMVVLVFVAAEEVVAVKAVLGKLSTFVTEPKK